MPKCIVNSLFFILFILFILFSLNYTFPEYEGGTHGLPFSGTSDIYGLSVPVPYGIGLNIMDVMARALAQELCMHIGSIQRYSYIVLMIFLVPWTPSNSAPQPFHAAPSACPTEYASRDTFGR